MSSKCESCIDVNICNLSCKGSKFGCSFYKTGNTIIVGGVTFNLSHEPEEYIQALKAKAFDIITQKMSMCLCKGYLQIDADNDYASADLTEEEYQILKQVGIETEQYI